MKFQDLNIGDSFTLETEGGLFIKTNSKNHMCNAVVIIAANVSSPVKAGETTNFDLYDKVLPVKKLSFEWEVITITSKSETKVFDK